MIYSVLRLSICLPVLFSFVACDNNISSISQNRNPVAHNEQAQNNNNNIVNNNINNINNDNNNINNNNHSVVAVDLKPSVYGILNNCRLDSKLDRNGKRLKTSLPLKDAACWSWAVTGKLTSVRELNSVVNFYDSVFTWTAQRNIQGLDIDFLNDFARKYPTTRIYKDELINIFDDALINNDQVKQKRVTVLLMQMILVGNGFEIGDNTSKYRVHMKYEADAWYGWRHWGISVKRPDNKLNFIQTVTGASIAYCSSKMWDEGLQDVSVPVKHLLPAQIDVLNTIIE